MRETHLAVALLMMLSMLVVLEKWNAARKGMREKRSDQLMRHRIRMRRVIFHLPSFLYLAL